MYSRFPSTGTRLFACLWTLSRSLIKFCLECDHIWTQYSRWGLTITKYIFYKHRLIYTGKEDYDESQYSVSLCHYAIVAPKFLSALVLSNNMVTSQKNYRDDKKITSNGC